MLGLRGGAKLGKRSHRALIPRRITRAEANRNWPHGILPRQERPPGERGKDLVGIVKRDGGKCRSSDPESQEESETGENGKHDRCDPFVSVLTLPDSFCSLAGQKTGLVERCSSFVPHVSRRLSAPLPLI
jgi:hypothetical protein